jgi:LemA protein
MHKALSVLMVVLAGASLSGCGYNKLQNQDESVKAAWSEVVNQYQRRADLVPNLVNTVKGFAAQEERVLVGVTEARARASSIQLTPELINDPVAFQKFQQSQAQLTSALKTLLATVEAYPDLKSSASFRDLAAQLEGTENRITVARNRYIDAVREYNVTVREFPTNLTANWFDFEVKPNFTVENEAEISAAPSVGFDTSTPSQQSTPVESAPATPPATN